MFGNLEAGLGGSRGFALLVTMPSPLACGLRFGGGGEGFEMFAEAGPGDLAVLFARPGLLAIHFVPAREMLQVDAGRGLVDFLPAAPGSEDKTFFQILFEDPEAFHAFGEGVHGITRSDTERG